MFHIYCSSHNFRFYDISKARSSTSDFERRRAESSGTRSFGRSDQSTGRAHVAWHPWMGYRDTMGYRWELLWWGWKLPSGKEQILVLPGRRWLQPRPLWNNATSELKLKACLKTLSILIRKKLPCALVLCGPASLSFPVQGCFTCGAAHGWDPQWSRVCGENPRSGKARVQFLSVSHGLRIQWRLRHVLVN